MRAGQQLARFGLASRFDLSSIFNLRLYSNTIPSTYLQLPIPTYYYILLTRYLILIITLIVAI